MTTDGERVRSLFLQIAKNLPEGSAMVAMREQEDSTLIELLPGRADAAPLLAIVPLDAAQPMTLIAGKGTTFEVPRTAHPDISALEGIRAICLAVIERGLEERVLLNGEEIVGATGTLDLPSPFVTRWRQLSLGSLLGKHRQANVKYRPWVSEDTSRDSH